MSAHNLNVVGLSLVAVPWTSSFAPVSGKEFLNIQSTIGTVYRFTLKPVHAMIRTFNPLYKKRSLNQFIKYRPILLLPLISKFIKKFNYIFGFKKFITHLPIWFSKESIDFWFCYLNDKILKGFHKGLMTCMIIIDLSKAFDTINHGILFAKIICYWFLKTCCKLVSILYIQ